MRFSNRVILDKLTQLKTVSVRFLTNTRKTVAMQTIRTTRYYYRNGRVREEVKDRGRQLHGLNRRWHFNGQLAEEARYRFGRRHGLNRQWADHGKLLGSFTLTNGTGIVRHWDNNGRLLAELTLRDGKLHGRTRHWLRDGTLESETFYLGFKDITRAAYLQAARQHPDWPQYADEPPGKILVKGKALERKRFELFIKSLLAMPNSEAGQWLGADENSQQHSLAKFRTAKAALRFVESLYAAGAEKVLAAPIYAGSRGKQFADWLLIELPGIAAQRRALRKICLDFSERRGGAMLPNPAFSESHLFFRLE